MRLYLVIFALFFTITGAAVSVAGALDRGGTELDKALFVAISVGMTAAVHFLLAISRRPVSWALWSGCLVCVIYGQVCFVVNGTLRAGAVRAGHTPQVIGTARQIEAARSALDGIRARPIAEVALELAATTGWQKHNALKLELAEARRAALLRDELVKLTARATEVEVIGGNDPVTGRIAAVMGVTEQSITMLLGLVFSILVELVGAFLWYEIFQQRNTFEVGNNSPPGRDYLSALKAEIRAGKIKPTVTEIRKYLECSQSRAMEVRRNLYAERDAENAGSGPAYGDQD